MRLAIFAPVKSNNGHQHSLTHSFRCLFWVTSDHLDVDPWPHQCVDCLTHTLPGWVHDAHHPSEYQSVHVGPIGQGQNWYSNRHLNHNAFVLGPYCRQLVKISLVSGRERERERKKEKYLCTHHLRIIIITSVAMHTHRHNTHTHTQPHKYTLSLSHTHTCTYTASDTHTHTHIHTHTRTCSLSHSHMHTHCHVHTHTAMYTHTHTRTHCFTYALSPTCKHNTLSCKHCFHEHTYAHCLCHTSTHLYTHTQAQTCSWPLRPIVPSCAECST